MKRIPAACAAAAPRQQAAVTIVWQSRRPNMIHASVLQPPFGVRVPMDFINQNDFTGAPCARPGRDFCVIPVPATSNSGPSSALLNQDQSEHDSYREQ
ncbi:hypothetical protein AAE026_15265 [Bradyrhizobium sp. DN5]|uniref:hypothetical protein n=1 Tax=unclassified Bradyrhizobium TaxID=2631580 RepID=UPI00352661DF